MTFVKFNKLKRIMFIHISIKNSIMHGSTSLDIYLLWLFVLLLLSIRPTQEFFTLEISPLPVYGCKF